MITLIHIFSTFLVCFLYVSALKIHVDPASPCRMTCDGSKEAPFNSLFTAMMAIDELFALNSVSDPAYDHSRYKKSSHQSPYLSMVNLKEPKIVFLLEPNHNHTLSDAEVFQWLPANSTQPIELFNHTLFENEDWVIEFKANDCKEPKISRRWRRSQKQVVVCNPPNVVVQSKNFVIVVKADFKISDVNWVGDLQESILADEWNRIFSQEYYAENNTDITEQNESTNETAADENLENESDETDIADETDEGKEDEVVENDESDQPNESEGNDSNDSSEDNESDITNDIDETTTNDTISDETPSNQTNSDEISSNETNSDETSVDETSNETTTNNESPGNETNSNSEENSNQTTTDTTSDDTTTEETTTNETTIDETISNETTNNETSPDTTSNETTDNKTSTDETSNETSTNQTTSDETSTNETISTDETTSNETTKDETISNETTSNETTTDETTSNETATNETATNETTTNETATNETNSNETTSNESNETISNETTSDDETIANETTTNETTTNITTTNPYSLFTFGNRFNRLNVTFEFSRSNITGFQSNDFSSQVGFIGFLKEINYKNNSFDVLLKDLTIFNVYMNSFVVNNNEQPLRWLGISMKLVKFINQNEVPSVISDSVFFRVGNVFSSKIGIKSCHFSGNLAGSLVSAIANTKISLKSTSFDLLRLPSNSLANFISVGDNSTLKVYNVSFMNSSIDKSVIFSVGSNNFVYLSEVSYRNYHNIDQENFGMLFAAGENNTIAINDILIINNSFASPVTHFNFDNLNRINMTRIIVSNNNYLLSDSVVFRSEDSNFFQMNDSTISNINFLNEALMFERPKIFSFRVNNVIEFLNNSYIDILGLGHLVVLIDFNAYYEVGSLCQNVNVAVISPDVNNPEENGGYIYAESDNYIGFEQLTITNLTLISEPNNFAIFGYVKANSTVYFLNVTWTNEKTDQILWVSGSGNNSFIFDNLMLINSRASYVPQDILYNQEDDLIISDSGSVAAFDYNFNPSRGIYFNSTVKEFDLCNMGCFSCNELGCSLCTAALLLVNGDCMCPQGYFLTYDTCVACNAHCVSCASSFDCEVCENGFDNDLNGVCSLNVESNISFSLESMTIQWTTVAKNLKYVIFTLSTDTAEEIEQGCIIENSNFVESENFSTVVFNLSVGQIALCGNMSEDLNFTYYSFKINAFENERLATIDYNFILQKTDVIYGKNLVHKESSFLVLVLVLACLVLAGYFGFHLYQYLKTKGVSMGKSRSLTVTQEMQQPLTV